MHLFLAALGGDKEISNGLDSLHIPRQLPLPCVAPQSAESGSLGGLENVSLFLASLGGRKEVEMEQKSLLRWGN